MCIEVKVVLEHWYHIYMCDCVCVYMLNSVYAFPEH